MYKPFEQETSNRGRSHRLIRRSGEMLVDLVVQGEVRKIRMNMSKKDKDWVVIYSRHQTTLLSQDTLGPP